MSSNPPLGPYVVGERVGTTVWLAEDTRNGRRVAIKLLTKALPKDSGKREAMIRDVRVSAALYHTFLVPIQEIAAVGDNLLMVMDVVEGQNIAKKLHGQPLDRDEFFRLAYQLASVVKYLHTKFILHGNINPDAVMVTADGQVKLGGLNLGNFLRREKTSTTYQQKGQDARCVAYMAPEQIASASIDERTDIFSLGAVMYEMATGRIPFARPSATDIARLVVEGQPLSPKTVNPEIHSQVMAVVGSCLFKDPFKRHKDAKSLVEAIEKLDSASVQFAAQFEKKVVAGAAQAAEHRRSILFIADVANYEELRAEDPGAAAKAAARMQQVLGESVYLFDGEVVDPFGTRMVATLPSVEAALEAGRKGEFDFSPEQQEGEPLQVRMLLHAGEVEAKDGTASGPGLDKALETLAQLPPNHLFISEDFVREGRGNVRLRDAGARGGMKLFTIVPPEPKPVVAPEPEPTTAELQEEEAAEAAELLAEQTAARKKKRLIAVAAAAALVLVLLAGAAIMWKRSTGAHATAPAAVADTPRGPQPATAANPRKVFVAPFKVEAATPPLDDQANAIRLGAIAILRSYPELRVVEQQEPDAVSVSAYVKPGAAGPELVSVTGTKTSAPAAILDVASGIRAVVQQVTAEVQARPRTYAVAAALNSFADAVVARSAGDATRADTSLRAAMQSDPSFLPAQLLAMEFFASNGKNDEAIAAAKQVVALDPANLDAARKVARASLITGDLQQAFALYDLILDRQPADAEALNHVARYSLSAGDTARFNATLARLRRLPPVHVTAHQPDTIAYAGRIAVAVDKYYDLGVSSPSISLKIGRFSVLRHSLPLAEIELQKLGQSDPLYGYHMLKAYMAAETQKSDEAAKELDLALAAAVPGDDSWTCAAEVHAILADTNGVIASLEKAAQRKEPTSAYIFANPLFRYLQNDPRYGKLQETFTAQQGEIRTALAQVR